MAPTKPRKPVALSAPRVAKNSRAAASEPASKGGRPRKAAEAAERLLSVRMPPADWELLEGLLEHEKAKLCEAGAMPEAAERVTFADVVRGLIRREAGRLGHA